MLLTHTHVDHAEGARAFAGRVGAPLAALAPAGRPWGPRPGRRRPVAAAGLELRPLPTPGHAADHCCFELDAERAVFTGDHVLGRGTTVVEWPGGDMVAYLASLRLLLDLRPERLYPGHGPLVADATARVEGYLAHRLEREAQVLAALDAGDRTPAEIVARVYAAVDPALHPAAELSVRAHLAKLAGEGRIPPTRGERVRPEDASMTGARLGVDVGGTFTDLVALVDGRLLTAKVPTTPRNQARGVVSALERVQDTVAAVASFAHGPRWPPTRCSSAVAPVRR